MTNKHTSSLDQWHYPRNSLARSIVDTFKTGIVHALTLFAPRRMGKTEFLTKDIMPIARESGYQVFYFSFMDDTRDDVALAFTQALYQFSRDNVVDRGVDGLKGLFKKVNVAGSGVELNDTALPSMSQIINELGKRKAPVLLLLDEIQELAALPKASGIVASLRTGLDLNRDKIKTIFTGSSRNGLLSMFDDSRAPFFHFSTNIDFPTLGDEFVRHIARLYQEITKQTIDETALIAAFDDLGRVPMHLRSLIKDIILDPNHDVDTALSNLKATLATSQNYAQTWQSLKPIDLLIIEYIIQGGQSIYSEENRRNMGQRIGVKGLEVSSVQSSMRRLVRQDLITKNAAGHYVVSSPNFAEWIKIQVNNPV